MADGVTAADRAAWQAWADARAQAAFRHARRLEAADDPDGALRWYERAHRLAPDSPNVMFPLAMARLRGGDAAGAVRLLHALTRRFDFREGWLALSGALLAAGEGAQAAATAQRALSRHAPPDDMDALFDRLAALAGRPGWCGLSAAGRLRVRGLAGTRPAVAYDGRAVAGQWRDGVLALPAGWRHAARIDVTVAGAPLLGSPLEPAALLRVEGVVDCDAGGLTGWAWHPADPDHPPRLRVLSRDGQVVLRVTASVRATDVDSTVPLARPRRFAVAGARLPAGPLRVVGPDGRDLTGSPVDPAVLALPPARPAPDTGPLVSGRRAPVAIVVPVHGARAATLACLASVRDSVGPEVPVWVVDDATPDGALAAALDGLAAAGSIRLIRHARTLGFPASANDGMCAAAGHDMVLLNSDTLVAGGWLAELAAVAYGAPDIGTVTPLSNDATIFSWPGPDRPEQPAPVPDLARVRHLMAAARAANGGQAVPVPTGHGFCLFLRHDCLA
ncbi:glycosyltransferase, partial [Gluconacetobacter azotocaptans]|uniref:glycosyltransferase n=1 Tax=Gluconacetobacter azotocaptans TaxID=142834 RepID=UPI00195B0A99